MALPKASALRWYRGDSRKREFMILSKIEFWRSHWDAGQRRSRKCGGEECALCRLGFELTLRYVVLGIREGHGPELLEFRARHYPVLKLLDESERRGVGAFIRVYKEGTATNSPVMLELSRRERDPSANEVSISRYVEAFGLPAKLISDMEEQPESGPLEAPLEVIEFPRSELPSQPIHQELSAEGALNSDLSDQDEVRRLHEEYKRKFLG